MRGAVCVGVVERGWSEQSLWIDRRKLGAISCTTRSHFGDTLEGGWRVVEHPTQGGDWAGDWAQDWARRASWNGALARSDRRADRE